MAQKRPTISYVKNYKTKEFTIPTYKEVKKRMFLLLSESDDNRVNVYRKRRGNWGEFFEHWEFNYDRKPVIVKCGWM